MDSPCKPNYWEGSPQRPAGETVARAGSQLEQIQYQLDETRRTLGEQMLQLTTVFPGQAYGGRIFLSRFKHAPAEQIRLSVQVGTETLAVAFMPAAAPQNPGADPATRAKWQRYFATLVASGVGRGQAHTMADEEFGAID